MFCGAHALGFVSAFVLGGFRNVFLNKTFWAMLILMCACVIEGVCAVLFWGCCFLGGVELTRMLWLFSAGGDVAKVVFGECVRSMCIASVSFCV